MPLASSTTCCSFKKAEPLYFRARVAEVTDQAQGLTGEELTTFLTKANQETVAYCRQESEKLWGQFFKEAIKLSKLTFNMDKNL